MFNKRIICIHSLSETAFPTYKFRNYILSMLKLGYKFIPFEDILDNTKIGRYLHITVDDGYKTCITDLLPILDEYDIKATFFIAPFLLGLPANHQLLVNNNCYPNEETMTTEDIQLLNKLGHNIGFHTGEHLNLSITDNDIVKQDFIKGLEFLSSLGISTDSFAYPFGFLPKDKMFFEELLNQSNMNHAFTVRWGDVNNDNRYYINRVCLGDKEPLLWSVLKTIGAIDFYYNIKH